MLCLVALLASCRDRRKPPAPVPPPAAAADTAQPSPQPTLREEQKEGSAGRKGLMTVQRDSMEVMQLRLFARRQRVIYAPERLAGRWMLGTVHQEFAAGGRGRYWDEADGKRHADAKEFEWTMDSNLLTITYRLEFGAVVPKVYLVTYVDDESLVYRDAYGESYMYDREMP